MKSSIISRVAVSTGLILGAYAVSVAAGTWNSPTATAPGNNTDAPVNVGTGTQVKPGWLGLRGLITTDFTLATGTPAVGYVLTAVDSLGTAKWAAPTGGTSGSMVLLDAPIVLSNPGNDDAFYVQPPHVVDTSVISGTIQAGTTTGVPAHAKGVLLYGSWDSNLNASPNLGIYIRVKQPGQNNWKRLLFIQDGAYGSDNSVWLPLDSSGRLQWEISNGSQTTGIRLEIQGYQL